MPASGKAASQERTSREGPRAGEKEEGSVAAPARNFRGASRRVRAEEGRRAKVEGVADKWQQVTFVTEFSELSHGGGKKGDAL